MNLLLSEDAMIGVEGKSKDRLEAVAVAAVEDEDENSLLLLLDAAAVVVEVVVVVEICLND